MKRYFQPNPYLKIGTSLLLGTAFGLALRHKVANAFTGVAVEVNYKVAVVTTHPKR